MSTLGPLVLLHNYFSNSDLKMTFIYGSTTTYDQRELLAEDQRELGGQV